MSVGRIVRDALLERPLRVLRASSRSCVPSGCCAEPLEDRCELTVDLGAGRVGDLPLRRVVLEVDRALREPVEPAAERVAVDVPEPEHATEPEHRDGLEVLAHQLCLAAILERVEKLGDERLDQVRRALPRRRAGGATDRASPGASSAARRRGAGCSRRPSSALSGDGLDAASRTARDRVRLLDVGPAGDEPEPDRRDEADGRLASRCGRRRGTDHVELLDRDRGGVGLDRAHVVVPSRICSVFRSE